MTAKEYLIELEDLNDRIEGVIQDWKEMLIMEEIEEDYYETPPEERFAGCFKQRMEKAFKEYKTAADKFIESMSIRRNFQILDVNSIPDTEKEFDGF